MLIHASFLVTVILVWDEVGLIVVIVVVITMPDSVYQRRLEEVTDTDDVLIKK